MTDSFRVGFFFFLSVFQMIRDVNANALLHQTGRFFPLRQPVRVSMIVLAIANLQETLSLFLFLCHSTLSSREWRPLRDEDLLLVLHVLTIVQSRKLMARLLKNTQPITGFFSGTTILEGIKKTSGSRRAKYMEDTDWKISRGWWIRLMVAKGTV